MGNAIQQLQKFCNDLTEYANDLKNGVFINKVAKECVDAIADDIETIFDTYIKEFYDSYTPKYYKRTGSLYDTYIVRVNGTVISWESPYFYPGGHRVSGEYIYKMVYEGGYHGGATSGPPDATMTPFPGYVAWRKPVPPAPEGLTPYSLWGRPATRSISPNTKINIDLSKYKNNGANISGHTPKQRVEEAFNYVNMGYSLFDWT